MTEEKSKKTFKSMVQKFFSGIGALIVTLVLLFAFFSIMAPETFPQWNNIYNLIRTTSVNGVAALGMMVAIICGGVDLSCGSVIGASVMLSAYFMSTQITREETGLMGIWGAMLMGLLFSVIVGFINGLLINDGKLPPFIATVAMQIIIRNFILWLTKARIIAMLPDAFTKFSTTDVLGLPLMAFVWFALAIITWLVIKFTNFGRNIFAVGSNPATARLSGISLRATRCGAWMYSALFAGLAGILLCTRLGNGIPSAGTNYEGDAIASAVVGGVSMSGGEGTVIGCFLGAIILQMIRNGGVIIGINNFVLEIIVGSLIIFCVLLDKKGGKKA
ncbi:MAG: ABC transporter permease [Christensenellaceae bacterium]|nr:ABC transporter permease [Christensenellaceae bacterium]